MKPLFIYIFVFTALIGCSASDPIDMLVASLTHHSPELDHYHFPNGLSYVIALPATASPAQLVASRPVSSGLDTTNVTVLEARHVRIAYSEEDAHVLDPNYTAILVGTDSGRKIVLVQFQGSSTNKAWCARVYDVK